MSDSLPARPTAEFLTLETKPPCPGGFVASGFTGSESSHYPRRVRPATAFVIIVLLVLILIAGVFQAWTILRA